MSDCHHRHITNLKCRISTKIIFECDKNVKYDPKFLQNKEELKKIVPGIQ